MHAMQVRVEKDAGSDIPDINRKMLVADSLVFLLSLFVLL